MAAVKRAGSIDYSDESTLPLWRIHNLSRNGAGQSVKITNIGRSDTIALLTYLSGHYGPAWANDALALAVDFESDLRSLKTATLVRIKEVTPAREKGTWNAEILVLCQTRVVDVNDYGPFPEARRAPDLAPLWRIHRLGDVGDASFDAGREDYNIENIAREDTVALLKQLGGGDATCAKGHLVLAYDFKRDVEAGIRAMLVRIEQVSSDKPNKPPFKSVLKFLGHIQCVDFDEGEVFPQALLDELPVWKIHNLDKYAGNGTHKICNIARADSIALLTHLGQGNALRASGGLVIGCDFNRSPGNGESAHLMRVTSISRSKGEGQYEAVLTDVSTVTVEGLRTAESERHGDRWWPRITIVLPTVWGRTARKSAGAVPRLLSSAGHQASHCSYWRQCKSALEQIFQNAGTILDDLEGAGGRDPDQDKCFCRECHHRRGDRMVYERGKSPYVLPVGFARIAIVPAKTATVVQQAQDNWHVCYHGTKCQYVPEIVMCGQLITPGLHTYRGTKIEVRSGHITTQFRRDNQHTGKEEDFDPTDKLFFSPSIKYVSYGNVYADWHPFQGKHYRCVLQVCVQPDTYEVGQQTLSNKPMGSIDPHVANKSIEWYSREVHCHYIRGILVSEA